MKRRGGGAVDVEVGGERGNRNKNKEEGEEDPLGVYKGLSLFRRSFSSLSPPADPDPLSSHLFLLSLPLKDAKMLAEEGRTILEGGSHAVDEKEGGGPRARRPGLGIKRARSEFRLRPPESRGGKENEVVEPAGLDIDKLKDPEELFLAFEKLENAKREIAKQTGRALPEQRHSTTWDPRPRRPGLPGRSRTIEYKHLYPAADFQDVLQENIASAAETEPVQEAEEKEPEEREVTNDDSEAGEQEASAAAAENQVNKILDELLTYDDEDLNGDGAMNLLRDRLQIKPSVIDKFKLPDMPEVRRIDLNTSLQEKRKRRTALSDVHNLLKEPRIDLNPKKSKGSLLNSASPTPPRSPLASLSLLRRSVLQLDPISDPFSTSDLTNSPKNIASPVKNMEEGSDATHVDKESRNTAESKNPSHQSMGDDMPSLGSVRDVDPAPNGGNLTDDRAVKEKSSLAEAETGVQKESTQLEAFDCSQTDLILGDHATVSSHSLSHSGLALSEDQRVAECSETHDGAEAQSDGPPLDQVEPVPAISKDQPVQEPALLEDQPVAGCSETHDGAEAPNDGSALYQVQEPVPAKHNEEKQESSTTSIKKRTMAEPRPQKKQQRSKAELSPRKKQQKRPISGRQSLAGSGTSWQTGVRRSTRIKSRPLEYWKGERFLYGRIHQSLVTVIGIKKFDSPANGKRTMKVKSFVSEEFKDLVDLAALD